MSENNSVIDAILARRSLRLYESRAVESWKVEKMVECACAAPSAMNFRPWHFIAVTEQASLDEMASGLTYGKMLARAPLAIVVCGENEKNGSVSDWWEEDCSAAMQNLLLAAEALELGAVWLGICHAPERVADLRRLLAIPAAVQVLGVAAIGYPAEKKMPHQGLDPDVLHLERW